MMDGKIRVGLIFGGKSGEHEVSLASAQAVLRALDPLRYDAVLIGVSKEGKWLTEGNPLKTLVNATHSPLLRPMNGADVPAAATALLTRDAAAMTTADALHERVDVAFPLIHGPNGEDGTIQGLLELADVPYVGAGVAASAVGMDKQLMKALFRDAGLPVVEFLVVTRRQWEREPEETIREIETALAYPCFVKPANLGSSVGVAQARNWDELTQALANAALYDRKILVERAVDAREIECSVLGNDTPLASLPGEVIPEREFYDYAAKYADERTRLIVPAALTDEQTQTVQELAVRAFLALDCSGMARVDFFLDKRDGKILVNEINTIPGFTAVSMYPRMWQASGLSYPQLLDRLIELALERHADKKRNKTTY
ncbi:MAG: D-alanine--D-alanine ligase [Chloroflexi bacterium]|nr:MAG: D-alanine--D-alanine ligase [Chloroflexota bacterium]